MALDTRFPAGMTGLRLIQQTRTNQYVLFGRDIYLARIIKRLALFDTSIRIIVFNKSSE